MFRFSPQMSNMLHRLFLVASQGQGSPLPSTVFAEEGSERSPGEGSKHDVPEIASKPKMKDAPRGRGEAALKDEAKSPQRLLCHI